MNFLYRLGLIIIALILSLLAHTIFTGITPGFMAAVYTFTLFNLFFRHNRNPYWFLFAFTTMNELLSHNKVGTFVFIACELIIIEIILAQNLHFTARFNRFIISACVFLITFPLLLVPISQYYPTLFSLAWVVLVIGITTPLIRYWRKAESYEFV